MMNRKSLQIQIMVLVSFLLMVSLAGAVDVAPRISDREIIEKLSILEAGQRALRFEMKSGQDALRSEMRSGQDALGKRIDDMNTRMVSLEHTMLSLFGAMVALIVALFAYIAWDRRTMLKPVVDRLDILEHEVISDLGLRNAQGSLLSRQLKALREYAKNDQKLTEILRGLSLL